jgi:hypothetical protein
MSYEEHVYWERLYEKTAAIRDAKGLRGLRALATLRPHPGVDSFGTRRRGQIGQG